MSELWHQYLRILWLLTVWAMTAQMVHAGAWLREKDTGFLSLGATVRHRDGVWRSENSLYAEYGLGPRVTLGLDINEIPGLVGHALVFVRLPIGSTERRAKLAFELGFGAHHWQQDWDRMLKSTFSVGRGFQSKWGAGWVNVDVAGERRQPHKSPIYKLDATAGLSSGRRVRPLLQLESTYISGKPLIWSVIPGILINAKRDATWLIGLERKTYGPTSLGLKVGLWRRF